MSTTEGIQLPLEMDVKGLNGAFGSMDAVLSVLNNINKTVADIGGKMSGVGSQLKSGFKEGEKGAESLIDKLGKVGLAIDGIKGIASSVMGTVAPIFEEGMSREATIASLKTLMPKGTDVEAYARDLRDSAMSGLYGAGTVTDAAKTMMSFGIDKDKTKQMLASISDIAGGNQQAFQSLVLSFSQATSLGKLQGQDKLQMIGAGFNPLTQIAKDLGKSVAEVDEMMGKGKISADMLADAFTNATKEGGTYFGSTKEQMSGLNGMVKSFQSEMANLYAELYDALKPLAEAILPKLVKALQFITEVVKGQHPIVSALATIFGALGVAIAAYAGYVKIAAAWTTVMTAKQWLLNLALNANPIGLVVAAIAALIAVTVVIIKKYDEWGAALAMILGPFGLIINLVQSFRRNWDDLVNTFQTDGIVAGLKKIGAVILDAILYPLQQMFELLGADSIANKLKGLRQNLGVNMGGITPGTEGDGAMGGENNNGASTGTTGSTAMNSGTKAVATGGTRNTSITINMGSLVHQISYNGGIDKNTRETTQDLQNALLRVLSAASSTAE